MINTQGAVVLGMVYNYLPFMILPLYSVMVKIENSLIEAAADLGCSAVDTMRQSDITAFDARYINGYYYGICAIGVDICYFAYARRRLIYAHR